MSVIRVTECRLCDSADLALVVSFTPTPPGDQYVTADKWNVPQATYPLDVLCCRSCGAVQLADTVDPALIYPEYLYTTSVSRGLDKHFEDYADAVMARVQPQTDALVVDIGSNDGTLLRSFQKRDCNVLGIDPAQEVAIRAEANGIPTRCAFFSEHVAKGMAWAHGPAQIITANHVMANVADLPDFIRGVKALLAPDGTFVFETGYWPAIVDGNLIDTIEHEHIHYFAVEPLRSLFSRHGLELVAAERNHAKGGSLRGYVQHVGAKVEASVMGLGMAERDGGYGELDLLAGWVEDLNRLEVDMKAQIARSKDETWVGYGAAVGSTLLLHQFGLGEKLTCLVDANPGKQGRLSPGYHLPVYHPNQLPHIKPDKIVILAWRYAEMIQQQHPEYAGKWILPLPQMVTA